MDNLTSTTGPGIDTATTTGTTVGVSTHDATGVPGDSETVEGDTSAPPFVTPTNDGVDIAETDDTTTVQDAIENECAGIDDAENSGEEDAECSAVDARGSVADAKGCAVVGERHVRIVEENVGASGNVVASESVAAARNNIPLSLPTSVL